MAFFANRFYIQPVFGFITRMMIFLRLCRTIETFQRRWARKSFCTDGTSCGIMGLKSLWMRCIISFYTIATMYFAVLSQTVFFTTFPNSYFAFFALAEFFARFPTNLFSFFRISILNTKHIFTRLASFPPFSEFRNRLDFLATRALFGYDVFRHFRSSKRDCLGLVVGYIPASSPFIIQNYQGLSK